MENIVKKMVLLVSLLLIFSCEEVIDLDIPTSPQRLVIEGNLDFDKDSNEVESLSVKLSLTTDYYSKDIPKVHNAVIWVENENSDKYFFVEDKNSGIYYSDLKKIEYYKKLKLHVEYLGDIYEAEEMFFPSPDLNTEQKVQNYFGKDFYIVAVTFKDFPTNSTQNLNYYLTESRRNNDPLELYVQSNEFTQGNMLFNTFTLDGETKPGDTITFEVCQISKTYYNYMFQLIKATKSGNSPFKTPLGQVRGNVRNISNPKKYPLGYFRITEKNKITHKVI